MNAIDPRATAVTCARYDRNARRYDLMTRGTERLLRIYGWTSSS